MRTIPLTLAISLLGVSTIVGIMVGYALTPEYRLTMYDQYNMDLGVADRFVDLRYQNAMIAHHRGAILLAEQAERSRREEIRALAEEIQKSEPKLIDELYAWKRDWYGDRRIVRDPVVAKLGAVDDTFDLRFLNALIAHHESGVRMAQEIRLKSSRAEILNNADAVESFLTESGVMLRAWRDEWY